MTPAVREKAVRSFVAVPLPADVQQAVFDVAVTLAPALPGVRWSRKVENLHVTVKFLGDVDPAKLAAFGADLQVALATLPAFDVAVRGMGAFPSARRANVIWAGVDDPSGGLQKAAALVETVAGAAGVGERETRPFRGHVTVGRAKVAVQAGPALARFGERAFGVATVGALHVYESQLGGGPDHAGSTYVLRHRAALASN
ncbi:MAG TPA: RNA 2',3'-cyclic phosphodiesterase [Polyangia bacterium]|nr:RNA 2',3'-cyclic phosphodiesterase [Polyangia bacterium]